MSATYALEWIARLLAVLAIVQSFEFLQITRATSDCGVWRWEHLAPELGGKSAGLRRLFGFFLAPRAFQFLNFVRILVSLSLILAPNALGLAILFVMHVLTLLRWLGTYNGGSDYMNLLLLWSVGLGLFVQGTIARVCLWYIALQLCYSYFKAGWIKLKVANWRSGLALVGFINTPIYERNVLVDRLSKGLAGSPKVARAAAWGVIIFEMTFPLSVFSPQIALVYMIGGLAFHAMNAYFFGLNRFLFAWAAAYPALYYCSGAMQ